MSRKAPIVLPLVSADASLARVGGKGRSLATLAAADLPVPRGFIVTTRAYEDFVDTYALHEPILALVADVTPELATSADRASASIQSLFEARSMPADTAAAISEAYTTLRGAGVSELAVAVRSSSTAEDLPDRSFAGQQDSYLNVRGEAALSRAIQRCWASLWTARAIRYRQQMNIDQRSLTMGVVVQCMVDAEVSGVLFTANPMTGDRSEMLVNASFGLGEAVVGGRVTPDTYVLDRGRVLDRASFQPKETRIGAKEEMVVCAGDQGTTTRPVPEADRDDASLSANRLGELAALCVGAEAVFHAVPQDIEWAVADGKCWLLQSRPITNLPAAPLQVRWDPPARGVKLIRRQVVENMPDPLSPLFEELYLEEGLDRSMEQMFAEIGMPFELDAFIERPFFLTVNGFAYCRAGYRMSWRMLGSLPRVVFWYVRALPHVLRTSVPRWRDEGLPRYLATVDRWKAIDRAEASDDELLSGVRALANADALYWFDVAFVMGIAKVTDGLLNLFLTSRLVPADLTSGTFLRGFPSRALDAQKDLEAIARRIDDSPSLHELVVATPAAEMLGALRRQPGGDAVALEIGRHLEAYGHQIYTLDFVHPTQGEDPLPVLSSLKALVATAGYDTPTRQVEMARQRERQARDTALSLGPVRRWLFEKFLGWAQYFGPNREGALFYIGAAWPTLRRLAFELGQRLVEVGTLAKRQDVFYLSSAELQAACSAREEGRALPEYGRAAEQRRVLRDARMRLHPPAMVPEGERWKIGFIDLSAWETQTHNAEDSNVLEGSAVSPGSVTAPATVIHSPSDFGAMKPGTVLVCATTTPAWTPLFAQAAGLVTDIGGILAHGSIVAREYGIPAVMGTGSATKRIVTGQQITIDGVAGTVTLADSSTQDPKARA